LIEAQVIEAQGIERERERVEFRGSVEDERET
jgi:hypothetical protein